MLLTTTTDGLAVHQLLCGREIADPSGGDPVFGMAAQMANFVYLVIDTATSEAAVVDAAWDCAGVARIAEELGARITGAYYTHKHFDHGGGHVPPRMTGGREVMLEGAHSMAALGAAVYVCGPDADDLRKQCGLADVSVIEEGSPLSIGRHGCAVLHTPGHTPGSVCFQVGDVIFTGDTLFIGACGRVDLPGSDPHQMHASLRRLAELPDELTVCPGHDYGPAPSGSMGREKAQNMMMRQAILSASPSEFAAVLARLAAPQLIYADAPASAPPPLVNTGSTSGRSSGGRRRRGPTGSAAQAVTVACCNVYASATGKSGDFFCVDVGRPAMQPGLATMGSLL